MSGADPDISEWMVLEKGQFQAFIGQFIFFSNKKGDSNRILDPLMNVVDTLEVV